MAVPFGIDFATSAVYAVINSHPAVLLPLADNGGPTFTHALDPTSPAIDHGSNPLALDFDQRGAPNVRVFGSAPDIGAFELVPDAIFKGDFE